MEVSWLKSAVFAATATLSTVGYSAVITDTVDLGSTFLKAGGWTAPNNLSWTHDLRDDGFVLGSALNGTLVIDFLDDGGRRDGAEKARIQVGVNDWLFDPTRDDVHSWVANVDYDTDLSISSIARLNADGLLEVTVKALRGDFHLVSSTLTVNTRDDTTSVPEPATLALFGLGLAGLGMARRKAAK